MALLPSSCTVQSNVTAHIKKLEDEVGAQLLVRANPVFPTPAGRTLLEHARPMLQSHDRVLALLQNQQADTAAISGVLRIGSMETTAALRLPALLTELRRLQPAIDLELNAQPSASLLAELQAGRIDCALSMAQLPTANCGPGPCSAKNWCWSASKRWPGSLRLKS
ncbi:LysR family transcriptional regulator [Staphylococcus epidermidis]|nr:LysR family transcriptional regulator [Staphylococcus epidermidis]